MEEWDNTKAESALEPKSCWWDRMGVVVLGTMEQQQELGEGR